MKYIKLILLISTVIFVTSVPFEVKSQEDCSQYKKLHKKWLCKSRGGTSGDSTATSGDSVATDEAEKKGWNWLRKIREFGGKNIGEAG